MCLPSSSKTIAVDNEVEQVVFTNWKVSRASETLAGQQRVLVLKEEEVLKVNAASGEDGSLMGTRSEPASGENQDTPNSSFPLPGKLQF